MIRFLEVNLNHPAHYLSFGPFSVSIGNLSVILAMAAILVIALFAPFPDHEHSSSPQKKGEK